MKPATATSYFTVAIGAKAAPKPPGPPTSRVLRVVRLLALAHRIDAMIQTGELEDLADAARRLGLTRARVTQLMNLLLLAPAIQEAILDLPTVTEGRGQVSERALRVIIVEPWWRLQVAAWRHRH